ncbi:MAG: GGDEF domain-containing protein [Armatimonadota bacterium]
MTESQEPRNDHAEHEATDALLHDDARFRAIFHTVSIGLCVGNLRGEIVESNAAFQRMSGYPADELKGKSFIEFMHPDDYGADWRLFRELMVGERDEYQVERRYLRKDGGVLWGRVTVSLVRDENGVPRFAVGLVENISERKEIEDQLATLLHRDELTGLYNRRGFFTLAEQQIKLAPRRHEGLLLVYADVDNLKDINDHYGHAVGDQALIETSELLQETFRDTDIIARFGGDEFVALAVDANPGSERRILARLREGLQRRAALPERRYVLSISCGTVFFDHAKPQALQAMIEQADALMYADKARKRARHGSGEQ